MLLSCCVLGVECVGLSSSRKSLFRWTDCMPIEKWIDTEKNRVHAVLSGSVALHEMVLAFDSSMEDPRFQDGMDILSDHTRLDKPIGTDEAKQLASHLQQLQKHFAGARWAVVTKMKASYGMMRMLSIFLEKVPIYLQVFYSFVEAEKWLSRPREDL